MVGSIVVNRGHSWSFVLNIHPRMTESGSSTGPQKRLKKQADTDKKQPTAQAERTPAAPSPPVAASTPAPSTRRTTTTQARNSAQEPSQGQENGPEAGQGPSGTQPDPDPQEFRRTMKSDLRNRVISPKTLLNKAGADYQEIQEQETEARQAVMMFQRELTEMKIRLEKIKKQKKAKMMKLTRDDLTATLDNSLEMGLDLLEDECDEEILKLRSEQEQRESEIELISLDDTANQEQLDALIAFNNEVIIDDDDEENAANDGQEMDIDAAKSKKK